MGGAVRHKTTWIDLTDMLVWEGHFTGVQRVTYEYALRYKDDGAKFFAYDAVDDRLFAIELDDVIEPSSGITHNNIVNNYPKSYKKRFKKGLIKTYGQMSESTRHFLNPYLSAATHTVRSVLHVSRKVLPFRQSRVSHYGRNEGVVFNVGDTVVLLGAGWNELRTLEKLREEKVANGIKIVQHINDVLPIYQPHLFADELPKYFVPYINSVIETADIVTVISQSTKRDIQEYCKERKVPKPPKIRVIRLGDTPQVSTIATSPAGLTEHDKFILAVGTFEIRKNYQIIYQAVKLAQLEGKQLPKIIIAGKEGWLTNDLRHVLKHDPHVQTQIIWLSDANDGQLRWLYEHCMFTLFPSLAEGWGLPIAESLGYGKTCLASGVSSMLEVGDSMVEHFSPYDPREFMEKILTVSQKRRYEARNQYIKENYHPFTWDQSYSEIKLATDS